MYNNKVECIYLILVLFLDYATSHNILGVFPIAVGSHYTLAYKLMKGLVEAGHNVTVITPYRLQNKPIGGTYTDIVIEEYVEIFQRVTANANRLKKSNDNILQQLTKITDLYLDMMNVTLHHPKVRNLIKSNTNFDAVISEHFFNDALKVFSHIFKCPLINLLAPGPKAWVSSLVGSPQLISSIPHIFSPFNHFEAMSFYRRMQNLLYFIVEYFWHRYYFIPHHEEIIQSAVPGAPSLWELRQRVSIVLINSHWSIYQPMPTVPNMVEIGGYHIDPPQKLPMYLQDFLDTADEGAVFFSMGSNLLSKNMSPERIDIFLRVFRNLKQKVLWKYENKSLAVSDNVLIEKWMPQQDILAHHNIKLFITHAGLLSIMETVHHAIPILAIPIYCDQPMNAQKAFQSGFGLTINYFDDQNFNEETLTSLINQLVYNPKYKKNARKVSKIFSDRPIHPMKNAVYWVEYAIGQNGVEHLKVAGVNVPCYKYFMMDVIVFFIGIFVVLLYSIKLLIKHKLTKIIITVADLKGQI